MGYKLDRTASFHHIVKRCDGGKEEMENGAVINGMAHQYLHIIEYKDTNTYITLNNILKLINMQREKPTEEQYFMIGRLLTLFEEEHENDKSSKGKQLIRREYKNRRYK
jgi:hypothetical protein